MSITVSTTILQQLGGRKFIAMTGAKDFVYGKDYLMFKLPGSLTKERANKFVIRLESDDTYTLELGKIFKFDYKVLDTKGGIYVENLCESFTQMTGLQTRL